MSFKHDYITFDSNICPNCGQKVVVQQINHYLSEFDLLPDGTIDESSERQVKQFDDDAQLVLYCPECGVLDYGYRDCDTGTKFGYIV